MQLYQSALYCNNWCLTECIPLISSPLHLQGWLTAGSAPFRPNPDSVTVDGKRQLPWLHSLYVSQFTWGTDLPHPEGETSVCVCMCACVWERERNTALNRMYRAQGRTSMPGGAMRWRRKRRRRRRRSRGMENKSWGHLCQITEDTLH